MFGYYFYKIYYKFLFGSQTNVAESESRFKEEEKNGENADGENKENKIDDELTLDDELTFNKILKKNIETKIPADVTELYHVFNSKQFDAEKSLSNINKLPCCYNYIIRRKLEDSSVDNNNTLYYKENNLRCEKESKINTVINGNENVIDNIIQKELESDYIDDIIDKKKIEDFYGKITEKKHSYEFIYNLDFKHLYNNYLNMLYKTHPYILKIHSIDFPFQLKIEGKTLDINTLKVNNFKVIKDIYDLLDNLNLFKEKHKNYQLVKKHDKVIQEYYQEKKNDIDMALETKINEKMITLIKINIIEEKSMIKQDEVGEEISNKNYYNDYRFNVKINDRRTRMLLNYNDDQLPFDYSTKKESNHEKFSNKYVLGNFTQIFLPHEDNNEIINNIYIQRIIDNILKGKPVFLFGYGSSGSGKTSSLIYYRDKNNESNNKIGIIPILCNKICNKLRENNNNNDIYVSITVNELMHNKIVNGQDTNYIFKYDNNKDDIFYIKTIKNGKDITEIEIRNPFRFNGFTNDKKKLEDIFYRYFAEFKFDEKTYRYDTTNNLAKIMAFLVDIDRNVKATNNNPQSSRSHVLIFIDFINKIGNNDTNLANIVVGDFAGVENAFLCDKYDTLMQMKEIQNTLTGKKFYLNLNDNNESLLNNVKDDNEMMISSDTEYIRILNTYNKFLLIKLKTEPSNQTENENDTIIEIQKIIDFIERLKIKQTNTINEETKIEINNFFKKIYPEYYPLKDDLNEKINYIAEDNNTLLNYICKSNKLIDYTNKKIIKELTLDKLSINSDKENIIINSTKKINFEELDYLNYNSLVKKIKNFVNTHFNNVQKINFVRFNYNFIKKPNDGYTVMRYLYYLPTTTVQQSKKTQPYQMNEHILFSGTIYNDYKDYISIYSTSQITESNNTTTMQTNKYDYNSIIESNRKEIEEFKKYLESSISISKEDTEIIKLYQTQNFDKFLSNPIITKKTTNEYNILKDKVYTIFKYKQKLIAYFKNLKEYYTGILKSCNIRKQEGEYINSSLNDLNECISIIVKDFINPFYNYIDNCNYVFTKNKIDKNMEYILKNPNNLLNLVIKHISRKQNKTDEYIINDLVICVFGVLDFSRTKNNPPPIPYIDLNDLQNVFNDGKDINTQKNKIKKTIESFSKNPEYKNLYQNYSYYNMDTPMQIFKSIKEISIINSASTMGTLEFFDKIAKLNTTDTICYDDDTRNIIDTKENFIDLKDTKNYTFDYNETKNKKK